MADALMAHETLDKEQIDVLMRGGEIPPPRVDGDDHRDPPARAAGDRDDRRRPARVGPAVAQHREAAQRPGA